MNGFLFTVDGEPECLSSIRRSGLLSEMEIQLMIQSAKKGQSGAIKVQINGQHDNWMVFEARLSK